MILSHGDARFRVWALIGKGEIYRFYLCQELSTGREYVLQIGVETVLNAGLDRAAFILRELKHEADLREVEHAKRHPGQRPLYFDQLFPELVASFVCEEQGGRRVNILAFHGKDFITRMVSLFGLIFNDNLRIDLRTSAWIMGRLLTLLAFAHGQNVTVGHLAIGNILVYQELGEHQRHFAMVPDWTWAAMHSATISVAKRRAELMQAASAVFDAIGGDEKGAYPYDLTSGDERYVEFLQYLASGQMDDAAEAHQRFYDLVYGLFGRTFYPFKTLPR